MIQYRLRESNRQPFPCPKGMDPTLHALLIQRGISSAEEAQRFLNPRSEHLHDPMLLGGMPEAVSRIRRALDANEPICVYGDYDVDGVSASSLLSDYLRSLGAEVEVYLPSRHTEGYGLNEAAIRAVAQRNRLMITVDCGVTSVELIGLAQSLGLDCIVTDHHQPAEALPACTVINPLLNGYPHPSLCGAGVAFKLVQALGGVQAAMKYIDIAALATVADVVPLTGENRVIVKLGLDRINKAPRPGIQALIDVSGMSGKKISAGNIAFQLAPRLNAGGRIGSAKRSYDLLLSPDPDAAQPIAQELEEENTARKAIEHDILSGAEKQLENFDFPDRRAIVIAGDDWNHGVIGLAASRLVEKYHYPTIVMAEQDGILTGSCRSIPGVDIHQALTAVSDCLIRFGGHKQAAGLTLAADRLEEFRDRLDAWLRENIPPACYIPDQEYDMAVHFDQLTEEFVTALEALQPTGCGNPAPVLRASPYVNQQRGVGLEGAHLKLSLSEHSIQHGGIFFRGGHLAGKLPATIDVLFTPKINSFAGRSYVDLEVKNIRPDDVLAEISAKILHENTKKHEFLTQMIYNNPITFSKLAVNSISEETVAELLQQGPQGTLILCADLAESARLLKLGGGMTPDFFLGALPEDPRAFNAVCCYAPNALPQGYRNIVLAGAPDWYEIPEGATLYRMDAASELRDSLPDVDALREAYKGVRRLLKEGPRWDGYEMLIHTLARISSLNFSCAAACLPALSDMQLIGLNPSAATIKLNPTRKTDPESSAVWRALQAWRGGH